MVLNGQFQGGILDSLYVTVCNECDFRFNDIHYSMFTYSVCERLAVKFMKSSALYCEDTFGDEVYKIYCLH